MILLALVVAVVLLSLLAIVAVREHRRVSVQEARPPAVLESRRRRS